MSAEAMFWSKVDKQGLDGCWLWNGAKNGKGYGNFRSRSAHVVSYEFSKGAVPTGLQIDHLCRVRNCVNPAHLEAVTALVNVKRAQITHCKWGHELSGDNIVLYPRPDGVRRRCLQCRVRHSLNRSKK